MIWTESSGARELSSLLDSQSQSLQYQITEVLDINNRGQIIAYGYRPGQQSWEGERFLLEPVPEPATVAALAVGTLTLLRRRRVRS